MILIIAEAITLASEGYRVFPTLGKKPAICGWQAAATDDPAEVEDLFMEVMQNGLGIGIATGGELLVLDIDRRDGPEVRPLLRRLPETRTVLSKRGMHLYLRKGESVYVGNRSHILPDIDVRGDGGLVIAPPSGGKRYYDRCEPAPVPQWLLDKLAGEKRPAIVPCHNDNYPPTALPKPIPRGLAQGRRRILHAPAGHQNSTLFKVALWTGANLVGPGRYPYDAARSYLVTVAQGMHNYDDLSKWTPAQIERQIDNGLSAGLRLHRTQ